MSASWLADNRRNCNRWCGRYGVAVAAATVVAFGVGNVDNAFGRGLAAISVTGVRFAADGLMEVTGRGTPGARVRIDVIGIGAATRDVGGDGGWSIAGLATRPGGVYEVRATPMWGGPPDDAGDSLRVVAPGVRTERRVDQPATHRLTGVEHRGGQTTDRRAHAGGLVGGIGAVLRDMLGVGLARAQSGRDSAGQDAKGGSRPPSAADGDVVDRVRRWLNKADREYREQIVPRLSGPGDAKPSTPPAGGSAPARPGGSDWSLPSTGEMRERVERWIDRARREYLEEVVPRLSGQKPPGVPETAAGEADRRREEAAERDRRQRAGETRAAEERARRERELAAAAARRREAEARARSAEEAERRRQAEARQAEEAERRRQAEARTAEEAERRRQAEARTAEEAERRRQVEARTAEEAERRRQAEARTAEEERAARERREAQRREELRRAQESAARAIAAAQAEAERRRAEVEARERKAAAEAHAAAEARRRAEEERIAGARREAEARARITSTERRAAPRPRDDNDPATAAPEAPAARARPAAPPASEARAPEPPVRRPTARAEPPPVPQPSPRRSARPAEPRTSEPSRGSGDAVVAQRPGATYRPDARSTLGAARPRYHRVRQVGPSATAHHCAAAGRRAGRSRLYVVASGDTLWRISRVHYRRGSRYPMIWRANVRRINNPDLIYPCQRFRIPKLRRRR